MNSETLIKDTLMAYSKLIGFPILTILDGHKMIISESDSSFALFCKSHFFELIQKCNGITNSHTINYENMDFLAYPIFRTETSSSLILIGLNNKQLVNPYQFQEIIKRIDSLGAILSILLENYKKHYLSSNDYTLKDIFSLSYREKQVLLLILDGHSNKEIAEKLQLSQHTVKNHVSHIFDKLNVSSRSTLISKYIHIRPILISKLHASQ